MDIQQKEIWLPIKNWEQYYEISNTGKVRSKKRIITDIFKNKNGTEIKRNRKFKEIVLKATSVCEKGHLSVGLYKNGRGYKPLIHRLVAEHFLPNKNNLPIVDHIDGNPTNNNLQNLRWCNYKENNANTPYVRYLQKILEINNINYDNQQKYYQRHKN